jgi:hypothetical protein
MAGFFEAQKLIKASRDENRPNDTKLTKEEVKKSQGAGTYGSGGSLAVHHVVVDLLWEIALVLVLSAVASRGGAAKTVATVLMIGIAVVWALNTFS